MGLCKKRRPRMVGRFVAQLRKSLAKGFGARRITQGRNVKDDRTGTPQLAPVRKTSCSRSHALPSGRTYGRQDLWSCVGGWQQHSMGSDMAFSVAMGWESQAMRIACSLLGWLDSQNCHVTARNVIAEPWGFCGEAVSMPCWRRGKASR